MPSRYGVGFAGAGQSYYLAGPNAAFWDARKPIRSVILWGHGAGSANGSVLGAPLNNPYRMGLVRRFVQEGCVVLASDWGGATWGAPPSNDYVEAGRIAIMTKLNVADDVPIGLYGTSMGNLVMMNYMRANPTRVAFMAGAIPLLDPGELRDRGLTLPVGNSLHNFADDINAAYGGQFSNATHGLQYSPVKYAHLLPADIPIKLWMGARDGTVPIATGDAFVAARPQTEREIFDTGHNDGVEKEFYEDIVNFCMKHIPR